MLVARGYQIGRRQKIKIHLYLRRSKFEIGEGRIQFVPGSFIVRSMSHKKKATGEFKTYLCILCASVA